MPAVDPSTLPPRGVHFLLTSLVVPRLRPVGRLAGSLYGLPGEVARVPRSSWADLSPDGAAR